MKILKFRVWSPLNKKMFPCYSFNTILKNKFVIGYSESFDREFILDDKNAIVQQFTGLKDKNGKEIYEGDIIRGKFLDTEYRHLETINSEVVWAERYACFNIGIEEWRYSGEPVTIIGNIFEHPELLNK
jgi:uncharacterized phage protein (TIGR01671 family)